MIEASPSSADLHTPYSGLYQEYPLLLLRCCCPCLQAQLPRSVYNSTGHGVVIVRCRKRRLFLISKVPTAM